MEEYYIGMLNLPMFTGPDDTSVVISCLCFFSAYMGTGDWYTEHVELPFGAGDLIQDYFGIGPTFKRSMCAVFLIYIAEVTFIMMGSM